MKTIASFEVDHTKLKEGIYLSRKDRDVVTYDLRFIVPNNPENVYMENAAMHTVEHLFAVHARNGKYGENIIYFGPMGCRTGFYLLTSGPIMRARSPAPNRASAETAANTTSRARKNSAPTITKKSRTGRKKNSHTDTAVEEHLPKREKIRVLYLHAYGRPKEPRPICPHGCPRQRNST